MSADNYIVKLLAVRDDSEWELREKLRQKEYDTDAIDAAINEAWDRKWLLPPEVLSQKVARGLSQKHKSRRYIHAYLAKKRLPEVEIEEEEEFEKAKHLAEKKFHFEEAFTFEDKKKVLQYLRNRAFQDSVIRMVIDEFERN